MNLSIRKRKNSCDLPMGCGSILMRLASHWLCAWNLRVIAAILFRATHARECQRGGVNFQANPNFDCRLGKRHMWCRQSRWLYSMTLSHRERQMSPDIDSQWVCRFVTAVWPDSNEAAFRAAFRQVHTQRGHSRPPSKAKKGWKFLSLALPPQCQPPFTKIQWFTVGVAAVIIGFSKCVRITTTKDNQTVCASHKTLFHHGFPRLSVSFDHPWCVSLYRNAQRFRPVTVGQDALNSAPWASADPRSLGIVKSWRISMDFHWSLVKMEKLSNMF